ncbi:MAG: hypothetical protein Q7U97_02535, partial [Rhodocyclaceae bacterium]|nr:hypothetical protein [Rhodocyclaceae bacterium]
MQPPVSSSHYADSEEDDASALLYAQSHGGSYGGNQRYGLSRHEEHGLRANVDATSLGTRDNFDNFSSNFNYAYDSGAHLGGRRFSQDDHIDEFDDGEYGLADGDSNAWAAQDYEEGGTVGSVERYRYPEDSQVEEGEEGQHTHEQSRSRDQSHSQDQTPREEYNGIPSKYRRPGTMHAAALQRVLGGETHGARGASAEREMLEAGEGTTVHAVGSGSEGVWADMVEANTRASLAYRSMLRVVQVSGIWEDRESDWQLEDVDLPLDGADATAVEGWGTDTLQGVAGGSGGEGVVREDEGDDVDDDFDIEEVLAMYDASKRGQRLDRPQTAHPSRAGKHTPPHPRRVRPSHGAVPGAMTTRVSPQQRAALPGTHARLPRPTSAKRHRPGVQPHDNPASTGGAAAVGAAAVHGGSGEEGSGGGVGVHFLPQPRVHSAELPTTRQVLLHATTGFPHQAASHTVGGIARKLGGTAQRRLWSASSAVRGGKHHHIPTAIRKAEHPDTSFDAESRFYDRHGFSSSSAQGSVEYLNESEDLGEEDT